MTEQQKALLAGLIGAGAGTAHGMYKERQGTGSNLETLLRALGYGGLAYAGVRGVDKALANSGIKSASGLEKEAAIPLLAAPLLMKALGAGFMGLGAYGAAKHGGRAIGDFGKGDFKGGMKNLGRAGVEGAMMIPFLGGAGRALSTGGRILAGTTRGAAKANQLASQSRVGGWAANKMLAAGQRSPALASFGQGLAHTGGAIMKHPLTRWGNMPKMLSRKGALLYGAPLAASLMLGQDPRDTTPGYAQAPARAALLGAAGQAYGGPRGANFSAGSYPYMGGANTFFPQPTAGRPLQITGRVGGYGGFPVQQFASSMR